MATPQSVSEPHPSPSWDAKKYRPGLDILRALAVGAVFVFHTRKHYLPGGWAGVDLFFAISGFLITGLLMREMDTTGRIDFKKFVARRAIRLLPALITMIVVLAILGRVTAFQAAAALFYFANWVSRFQGDEALGNVLHTWSLSAEEQFYLVWPFLIIVCFGVARKWRQRPRVAVFLCAGLGVLATITLNMHMETLFAGSMAALVMPELIRRGWAKFIAVGGVFGAGVLLLLMLKPQEGLTSALAVMCSTVLFVAGVALWSPSDFARKLSKPILWVGRISYGIYLWHFPLYMTLPLGMSPARRTAIVLVATLCAATASWYLIERPLSTKLRPLVAK